MLYGLLEYSGPFFSVCVHKSAVVTLGENIFHMYAEEIREYLLLKEDVTEGFPFGEDTLVFKRNAKVFALVSLDSTPLQFNVKCDPETALQLREDYPGTVLPGYHMNKKHWNTVIVDGELSRKLLIKMLDDSYRLVGKLK